MPCFKGLAVSIHTPEGPIAEHSIQKQQRQSRISSYIPVPPAKVPTNSISGKPEQSSFAISITLLTPGLNVPYSQAKPTREEPNPQPRVVGGLPGSTSDRGKYAPAVQPYVPRTNNPNETIAAYIYFDGRAKEEVATLLRRGEETWVNSRWVSVPDSEGGGLAEREFLFREVGLERWLNGLDLQGSGKEKAERIEKRQRRLEKKRLKVKKEVNSDGEEEEPTYKRRDRNGILRYGGDGSSPVEDIPLDDDLFSDDSDSDDEPPEAEAAGQIKVALFRVLASGEIKRGEYSPQFDAHDDDEGADQNGNGEGGGADIDHTTSFAKPKTLDPKSISTQTVTGLDPPESPYAVFTFFYRGEKQLQKMGIVSNPKPIKEESARRKSTAMDYSKLGPLKSEGTVGYSGWRETPSKRKSKNKDDDAMDSDADDEDEGHAIKGIEDADTDAKPVNGGLLSPEDAKRQGELTEGVSKIKLKRQHSSEPVSDPNPARKSPHLSTSEFASDNTTSSATSTAANAGTPPDHLSPFTSDPLDAAGVASPYKRQRASVPGLPSGIFGHGPDSLSATAMANAGKAEGSLRANSTPEVKIDAAPILGLPQVEDGDEEL
ncbi:uncharacterized protein MYCGRDRAFT_99365 [Zymoseptoria tritici IPO323]|uniref:DUF7918 domain-containing protein n=1 Tax=Zymoseptoria tritici (strain CBS 115943 / IPO323) TaxID=336722 RepID=F9X5D9_ZYMTI|nr:uncharacterized protein MYCGRDRAFT_99365 [Zymoseptoria tritici IPO323]EGP89642.1 hypothetical protein MYCGRDRAFT_99365 [Zymoseptoria tritici IPO323]